MSERVAIVTGGLRGIGQAVTRQLAAAGLYVVATSREADRSAAPQLGSRVRAAVLDVSDGYSVRRFLKDLADTEGRADVLVNNAGVYLDSGISPLELDLAVVRQTMEVNYYGPLRMIQALVPLMRRHDYGRIVNVSSRMGSLAAMDTAGGSLAYRTSKAALNALTRVVAGSVRGSNIKVNAASPGWVQTDMGGAGAPRTPDEGADTIVWLATLGDDGPSGGFFHDRRPQAW